MNLGENPIIVLLNYSQAMTFRSSSYSTPEALLSDYGTTLLPNTPYSGHAVIWREGKGQLVFIDGLLRQSKDSKLWECVRPISEGTEEPGVFQPVSNFYDCDFESVIRNFNEVGWPGPYRAGGTHVFAEKLRAKLVNALSPAPVMEDIVALTPMEEDVLRGCFGEIMFGMYFFPVG